MNKLWFQHSWKKLKSISSLRIVPELFSFGINNLLTFLKGRWERQDQQTASRVPRREVWCRCFHGCPQGPPVLRQVRQDVRFQRARSWRVDWNDENKLNSMYAIGVDFYSGSTGCKKKNTLRLCKNQRLLPFLFWHISRSNLNSLWCVFLLGIPKNWL